MREKREGRARRGGGGKETPARRPLVSSFLTNVKILIGPSSKHVNHSVNTLIRLAEINITLLSNLIDLSVTI